MLRVRVIAASEATAKLGTELEIFQIGILHVDAIPFGMFGAICFDFTIDRVAEYPRLGMLALKLSLRADSRRFSTVDVLCSHMLRLGNRIASGDDLEPIIFVELLSLSATVKVIFLWVEALLVGAETLVQTGRRTSPPPS